MAFVPPTLAVKRKLRIALSRALDIVQGYVETKPVGISVGSKAIATIVVDTAQRIRRDLMTELETKDE